MTADEPDPNVDNNRASVDTRVNVGANIPKDGAQPCAPRCQVGNDQNGPVSGSGVHGKSMEWALAVRDGLVPAGQEAIVILPTTARLEFFTCNVAVAGTPTTCLGSTEGDGLVGGTVRVFNATNAQVATALTALQSMTTGKNDPRYTAAVNALTAAASSAADGSSSSVRIGAPNSRYHLLGRGTRPNGPSTGNVGVIGK